MAKGILHGPDARDRSLGARAGTDGGNGIRLDYQRRAASSADAEALYSYEGTREMNSLIVGKAITGFSAFV